MARTDKHRMTREEYKNIVEAQNQRKNSQNPTTGSESVTSNYSYTNQHTSHGRGILASIFFTITVITVIVLVVSILFRGMDFLFYNQNVETKLALYIITFTFFLIGLLGMILYTANLFISELKTFLKNSVLSYLKLFSIFFVGLALVFITLIWLVSLIIMLSSIGKAKVYCGIVSSDPETVRVINRRGPDTTTKKYTIW